LRDGCERAFGHPTFHILQEIRWFATSSRTVLGQEHLADADKKVPCPECVSDEITVCGNRQDSFADRIMPVTGSVDPKAARILPSPRT